MNTNGLHNCRYCSADIGTEGVGTCAECMAKISAKASGDYAPFLLGLSDGPGTQQVHFNRPDPLKEITRTARRSEDRMDAKTKKIMAQKIANLKAQEPLREKKDYGKDGHPAFEGMNQ